MKINIGAGDTRYEGFVNVDYDALTKPDYVVNLEKDPLPFEDNTVEQVIAHHILEHLGEGYFHLMKEIYRVCKHGAMIHIRVPHHRHETFLDDPTHRRPITVAGMHLFSKKHNDECRRKNYASSRLGYYFDVDFEVVNVVEVPDPNYIKIFEGRPVEEVTRYMHEHNNTIIEVEMQLVVVKE